MHLGYRNCKNVGSRIC